MTTPKDVLDLLVAGKALIEDPEHWTRGAASRFKDGRRAGISHPEAYCFCSIGALERAFVNKHYPKAPPDSPFGHVHHPEFDVTQRARHHLFQAINGTRPRIMVSEFNDTYDHQSVMQVWDKAIMTARAEVVASADWAEQEAESRG